jgi:hypothetical protein
MKQQPNPRVRFKPIHALFGLGALLVAAACSDDEDGQPAATPVGSAGASGVSTLAGAAGALAGGESGIGTGGAAAAGTAGVSEACSTVCGEDEGCYEPSGDCVACNNLATCTGEEGHTGRLLARKDDDEWECICETAEGYYTDSASELARPCDADGDGWVSVAAQAALDGTDEALRLNTRCAVREVSRVVLQNEAGAEHEIELASPLPLYESVRNDDAVGDDHPQYGSVQLAPSVLNSMTKLCVDPVGDFNDNGVPDVSEWAETALGEGLGWSAKLQTYFTHYARFAYFAELHDGWFEAADGGTYRIVERQRTQRSGRGIPLEYGDGADPYWQLCLRYIDVDYGPNAESRAGGDFSDEPDAGMTHTSQFKCVRVVDEADYGEAHDLEAYPEIVFVDGASLARRTSSGLTTEHDWTPNVCGATGEATPAPNGAALPVLTCDAIDVGDVQPGVYWMAVDFQLYEQPEDYERGCVDQCAGVEPECQDCSPTAFGRAELTPDAAGASCVQGKCDGFGNCGDCVPADVRCKPETNTQQVCSIGGAWEDTSECGYCSGGECLECEPEARRCIGNAPQECVAGYWQNDEPCPAGWKCAGEGTCSKKDDGEACTSYEECASGSCGVYYRDADGDGYGTDQGSGAALLRCGTQAPDGYVTTGGDCCDSDWDAKPHASAYHSAPRIGCGGYDYNCKDGEEPSASGVGDPGWCADGWVGSQAPCGAIGSWWTCYFHPEGDCGCVDSPRTQTCR